MALQPVNGDIPVVVSSEENVFVPNGELSAAKERNDKKRRRIMYGSLLVTLALIGLAVGLGVGLASRSTSPASSSTQGAPSPTSTTPLGPAPSFTSFAPTGAPSDTTSPFPSTGVTLSRTNMPSDTSPFPSSSVTFSPSNMPNGASPFPSSVTSTPTVAETRFPSLAPTFSPSRAPTASPTRVPSSSPTSDEISEWLSATVTLQDGVQYQIVDQLFHDSSAFTQGLTYANGALYQSTGLYGRSSVRELDPDTGEVLVNVPLSDSYFGEGLAHVDGGTLVQITYRSNKGFVYNATDLMQSPIEFDFDTTTGEGWGITFDSIKNELIVSDGSNNLHFWDPNQLGQSLRTLAVTRPGGSPATRMNELEFWRGRVLANAWFENVLLVIHPETGVVEKEYDFENLWPESERPSGTNVFNGISVSQDPDILYVTGKLWDRMYKIKLLP